MNKHFRVLVISLSILGSISLSHPCAQASTEIKGSVFFPPELIVASKSNAVNNTWVAGMQKVIVNYPTPWMKYSDDQLWEMMFGNTIKRSWMVWSNGYCPACNKNVPMYNWEADPLAHPWKMRCPHCKEYFPKNDFYAFYKSGLDAHGIFDPKRADRSLLFNSDHPNPRDPLHMFGVDDGDGYIDGNNRWRFIGAYLIRGQWKIAIVDGIKDLADAYVVTGDKTYAHKALVLLDRVADLYPTFDFKKEGLVYEKANESDGYVSVWHDACGEARVLAQAYDEVRGALNNDPELVHFLAEKAKRYGISNPKSSPEDIQRNIEDRILRDPLDNRKKTESNYPQTDITFAIIRTILGGPENDKAVEKMTDDIIDRSTKYDGLSGEKGLTAYSSFPASTLVEFLEMYSRIDPQYLKAVLKRHPKLYQMYRFYIDTYCLNRYYPEVGDTGAFGLAENRYPGAGFSDWPRLAPSAFTFMGQLYAATGDPAFLQVAYNGNRGSTTNMPYDMFASDPQAFQKMVADVVAKEGRYPKVGSVNKQEWHLGILRSGKETDARALWMEYDSGGDHGHFNGMNLGLFAKEMDLMPDFGYPPVQFGGWTSPKAVWYTKTAAHNTVVVDGQDHSNVLRGTGATPRTTLWADGTQFHAMRASCPEMIGERQFDRTAVLTDISDRDFYVLDIFRVVGGTDHAKFLHSNHGQITAHGLNLTPTSEYGYGAQMRNFRFDRSPKPGWDVDWKIEDRNHYRTSGTDLHLRYIDLTADAQAYTAEDWVVCGSYGTSEEAWIPSVMTRRQSNKGPLSSTFISIIEPYEGASKIVSTRKLPLTTLDGKAFPESEVAVEVVSSAGCKDLFIAADADNPVKLAEHKILVQKENGVRTDGDLCMIRRLNGGAIQKIVLCRGSVVVAGNVTIRMKKPVDFLELRFDKNRPILETGNANDIQSVLIAGKNVWQSPTLRH